MFKLFLLAPFRVWPASIMMGAIVWDQTYWVIGAALYLSVLAIDTIIENGLNKMASSFGFAGDDDEPAAATGGMEDPLATEDALFAKTFPNLERHHAQRDYTPTDEVETEEIPAALGSPRALLAKTHPEAMLFSSQFDDAIVGTGGPEDEVAVYCFEGMQVSLIEADGLSFAEAKEYLEYNVVGSIQGPWAPIVLYPISC